MCTLKEEIFVDQAVSGRRAGFKGIVLTQAEAEVEINTILRSETNTDTNREYYTVYCVCFFFVFFVCPVWYDGYVLVELC